MYNHTSTPANSSPGWTVSLLLAAVACALASLFGAIAPALAVPTVAKDDSYTTKEDTTLVVGMPGVLKNDHDRDGRLKADITQAPRHGHLRFQQTGNFTYFPNKNYNGGDFFKYRACEVRRGNHCASARVNIRVIRVNDQPDAVDDSYQTNEDTTLPLAAPGLMANDKDVDGDALKATLVSGPLHGTATIAEDGSLNYHPSANYNGTDSLLYRVTDPSGAIDEARAEIEVAPQNDLPIARPDKYYTKQNHNRKVPNGLLRNDTDPDGDEMYVKSCTNNKHVRVTCYRGGRLSLRPKGDWTGTTRFRYTSTDRKGGSDSSYVTVVVYKPHR